MVVMRMMKGRTMKTQPESEVGSWCAVLPPAIQESLAIHWYTHSLTRPCRQNFTIYLPVRNMRLQKHLYTVLYVHTCYTLMILTHSPLCFCGQNITSATLNRSLLYTLDPYHTLLILQIHVHGNCILICNWLCDILVRQLTIHMHSCLEKSPITTTNIFWVMTKYHQFTYPFSTFIVQLKKKSNDILGEFRYCSQSQNLIVQYCLSHRCSAGGERDSR